MWSGLGDESRSQQSSANCLGGSHCSRVLVQFHVSRGEKRLQLVAILKAAKATGAADQDVYARVLAGSGVIGIVRTLLCRSIR